MELSNIFISAKPDWEAIESELQKDYDTGGIYSRMLNDATLCSGERVIPTRLTKQTFLDLQSNINNEARKIINDELEKQLNLLRQIFFKKP